MASCGITAAKGEWKTMTAEERERTERTLKLARSLTQEYAASRNLPHYTGREIGFVLALVETADALATCEAQLAEAREAADAYRRQSSEQADEAAAWRKREAEARADAERLAEALRLYDPGIDPSERGQSAWAALAAHEEVKR